MKKIVYIAILLGGLSLVSCNDFLDRDPKSDIKKEFYWKTEGDIQKWNAGSYIGLQETLKTQWADWGEIRGGSFFHRGTASDQNLMYNSLTSLSASASWENLYKVIYRTNASIKYIPTTGLAESTTNPYLAEAHVMRALMYFYAIRVWGDVPKITEPLETFEQERNFPRESIHNLKTFMLADIEKALGLFDPKVDVATANKYYLNKGSALALKIDILMWFKEYEEALNTIDVLTGIPKGYELAPTNLYKTQFLNPQSSKEMIFNLWWDYTENGDGFGMGSYYAPGSSTMRYQPTEEIFTELVDIPRKYEDQRAVMIIDTAWISHTYKDYITANGEIKASLYPQALAGNYGDKAAFQLKCPKFSEWGDTENENKGGYVYPANAENETKMPIYRLADILLLKAEALTLMPSPDFKTAIQIVNQIRQRAGWSELLDEDATYTQDEVLTLILEERMYEFWGEGKHWFDLVRTDKVKDFVDATINKQQGGTAGFEIGMAKPSPDHIGGYGRMLWPIHSNAFLKNPLLDGHQNKPYDQ